MYRSKCAKEGRNIGKIPMNMPTFWRIILSNCFLKHGALLRTGGGKPVGHTFSQGPVPPAEVDCGGRQQSPQKCRFGSVFGGKLQRGQIYIWPMASYVGIFLLIPYFSL